MKSSTEISAYTWFQVFVASVSLFALGWMDNARSPFFPLLLENASSNASVGSLFFALASFTAILSSAFAGRVISLFGLKFLLILGGLLMSLSPFGLVFSPTIEGSFVTAVLFGLSLGFVAVGQNVLVSKIENEEFKRRFFSLLHCFYALAAMTAPISVLHLKDIFEWNFILVGVVFLSLPFVVLSFFLKNELKDKKSSDFFKSSSVKSLGHDGSINSFQSDKEVKKKQHVLSCLPQFNDVKALSWILFMCFYISSELILSTRMVVLVKSFGRSYTESSHALFYFFLCMFTSRLMFFIFKFKTKAINILFFSIIGGFLSFTLGYVLNPFYFVFVGFFMGPVFPTVMDEVSELWPKNFETLVSRIISMSSLFVVLVHISVGQLTDSYGIKKSMTVVFALLVLAFLVLVIEKKKSL